MDDRNRRRIIIDNLIAEADKRKNRRGDESAVRSQLLSALGQIHIEQAGEYTAKILAGNDFEDIRDVLLGMHQWRGNPEIQKRAADLLPRVVELDKNVAKNEHSIGRLAAGILVGALREQPHLATDADRDRAKSLFDHPSPHVQTMAFELLYGNILDDDFLGQAAQKFFALNEEFAYLLTSRSHSLTEKTQLALIDQYAAMTKDPRSGYAEVAKEALKRLRDKGFCLPNVRSCLSLKGDQGAIAIPNIHGRTARMNQKPSMIINRTLNWTMVFFALSALTTRPSAMAQVVTNERTQDIHASHLSAEFKAQNPRTIDPERLDLRAADFALDAIATVRVYSIRTSKKKGPDQSVTRFTDFQVEINDATGARLAHFALRGFSSKPPSKPFTLPYIYAEKKLSGGRSVLFVAGGVDQSDPRKIALQFEKTLGASYPGLENRATYTIELDTDRPLPSAFESL